MLGRNRLRDLDQLMEIEEGLITHIIQTVLKDCAAELKSLGRDTASLQRIAPPFPRISYDDAANVLAGMAESETNPERKELLKFEWGMDFGAPHETALTSRFDRPVFVYGYPTAVKAFYMEPWPGRPEVCKSVDLLAPEGYGEVCGGSERISDHDLLLAHANSNYLKSASKVLELRSTVFSPPPRLRDGSRASLPWLCGIEHIREASSCFRTIKRAHP
jgi:asparaginyl-tRNA synthetase